MPLINLQTDLRSLRFGNDRPGGGSSNQPYIQKPIPSPEDSPSNIFNTGGKDVLIRGGLLAPIKGVNDVSRLSQMFFDFKSPSGPLFTAKQNLLSRTSVKTEASKGVGYGGGGVNQGVYLPTSTILQAGVGFTGTHLNLLGIDPSSPISGVVEGDGLLPGLGLNGYSSIMKQKFNESLNNLELLKKNNRLVGLYDAISSNKPLLNFGGQKGVNLNPDSNGNVTLLEYGGGPGSILGIGKTRIPFADQRTGKNNPLATSEPKYFDKGGIKLHDSEDSLILSKAVNILNSSSFDNSLTLEYNKQIQNINGSSLPIESYNSAEGFSVYQDKKDITKNSTSQKDITKNSTLQKANNSLTFTQTQIIEAPENSGKSTGQPSIQDFRKTLLDGKTESRIMSLAPNYNGTDAKNIEERLSLGDPGKAKDVLRYSVSPEALDKLNASGFYSAAGPNHSKDNNRNDLVKFSIGILQNNGTEFSNYIHFRAFIEGFSDSYNATWSDVQYVGRGDKFYNYGGFTREISMGWTVYAQSKAELIPMYKKLNYLATSLAPDYSSGGFMRGSLARLTVGGYLYNQLGIIKSLTYTIPDESTWEIGIDENGANDESVKELAHMIKVSGFTFIPIQDKVPQKGRTKFIQLTNGMGEGDSNWSEEFYMPVDQPKTKKEVEAKASAENDTPSPPPPPVETTTNVTLETVTAQDFLYTAEVDNTTNVIRPRL
jgi:hypothetical protein